MSVLITTHQQVNSHPCNTSKAKAQFSFPKSRRFSNGMTTDSVFYDLPTTKMKRTTTFGYGYKFDFTKAYKGGVAPGTYNVKSQIGLDRKKGFSLGQRLENGSMSPTHRYTPGPGAYELGSTLTRVSYSLAARTTNFAERGSFMESPGPGTYKDTQCINKTGQYFLCKFKSSGATKIPPATTRTRGISSGNNSPGPGRYEMAGISRDGNYFNSKHHSSNARTFGKGANRSSLELKIQTPGPGSYLLPSDFGVYVSTNAPEASRSTRSFSSSTSKKNFRISSSTGALLKHKRNGSVGGTPSQTPVPFSTESRNEGHIDGTQKTMSDSPNKKQLEEVKEHSRFEESHMKTPQNNKSHLTVNVSQANNPLQTTNQTPVNDKSKHSDVPPSHEDH